MVKKVQFKAWRGLFFASLAIWLILVVWIAVSAATGGPPLTILRALATSPNRGSSVPIPHSWYSEHGYPIEAILPASNLIQDLNAAGQQIKLSFTTAMDSTAGDILEGWSVTSDDSRGELDFRNWRWVDDHHFVISLNRELNNGESLRFTFCFRQADGKLLRPLVLEYR